MYYHTPKPYTKADDIGDFTGFDREYEQNNMGFLIRSGWPVNWNYVNMGNIGSIVSSVVYRTILRDASQIPVSLQKVTYVTLGKVGELTQQIRSLKIKGNKETGFSSDIHHAAE